MQGDYTGHVTPAEWRWIILFSCGLTLIAFLPLVWVVLLTFSNSEWQFMGILHHPSEGAIYLSQIAQGMQDQLTIYFLHTPEPHNPIFNGFIYVMLGRLAELTGLSLLVVFHMGRVAAALFMYLAFYQLAARIWTKVRSRMIFFALVSLSSGLGWLLLPLTGAVDSLDLTAPHFYPFYSTLVSVHVPFGLGCAALLASVLIMILRPGSAHRPTLQNGGVLALALSMGVSISYPLLLIPLLGSFAICAGWAARRKRKLYALEWLLWLGVIPLALGSYYAIIWRYNAVAGQIWSQWQGQPLPSPLLLPFSLGICLVLALPGVYRGVRWFEPDGDQLMIVWLVMGLGLMYLPVMGSVAFGVGLMLPLAYFATRGLEDFWFQRVGRSWRGRLVVALLPLMAASHFLVLVLPLRPISAGDFAHSGNILLQRDYVEAFSWLRNRASINDVVLIAPEPGLWLPTWAMARVIYGHPAQTIDSSIKSRKVEDWYQTTKSASCGELLQGALSYVGSFVVRFVVVGPQELALGSSVCLDQLRLVRRFGQVEVYLYAPSALPLVG